MGWIQRRSGLFGGLFSGVIASVVLLGCDSTPRGDTGGRIDSYETTKEERHSAGANISSMLDFSDQVAEKLGQDISQIPELRDAPTKLVISLGDLNNKTATPTTDYELIQKRIRSKILNSNFMRDRFIVVEDRRRVQRQLDDRTGPTADNDPLDEGRGSNRPSVQNYDPASTYLLLGDFLEANRGGRSQYLFSFSLTNLKSGSIVFEKSYDLGQVH